MLARRAGALLVYHIPYFSFCYVVNTRIRVILVAELRYVPFHLHVVLLGIMYLVGVKS